MLLVGVGDVGTAVRVGVRGGDVGVGPGPLVVGRMPGTKEEMTPGSKDEMTTGTKEVMLAGNNVVMRAGNNGLM